MEKKLDNNSIERNNDIEKIEALRKALYEKELERIKKSRRRKSKMQNKITMKETKVYKAKKKKETVKRAKESVINVGTLDDALLDKLPVRISMKKAC